MNKLEKKVAIINHCLNVVEETSKRRGWRSRPCDVTIYMPGIADIMPTANAIRVQKLEHYNPANYHLTYTHKMHFVHINLEHSWERDIASFDKQPVSIQDRVLEYINGLQHGDVEKVGRMNFYSMK